MKQKAFILVVEDEQKIRTALEDFLEFHEFKVASAVDGLEAERIVVEKQFDLILLRRDGLQTPIIMLTAKGQENEKVDGLNIGADDYITKPFSLEELLARIHAILRRTDPARAVGQSFEFADIEVDVPALKVRRAEGPPRRKRNTDIKTRSGDHTILRRKSQPRRQQGGAL